MVEVSEIFKSIQGESSYTGLPCIFVRLTGCNLRCSWCDTPYAFVGGHQMSVDEIVAKVDGFGIDLVEITGGEPLLQPEVYDLMQNFLDKKYLVLLETGGSISIKSVPKEVIKIMDIKCPSSGESGKNHFDNLNYLDSDDQVKFVLQDRQDYEYARRLTLEQNLCSNNQVLFSPVFDKLDLRTLAEWILEDNLAVRLQTQLHKHIWDKNTIGV